MVKGKADDVYERLEDMDVESNRDRVPGGLEI